MPLKLQSYRVFTLSRVPRVSRFLGFMVLGFWGFGEFGPFGSKGFNFKKQFLLLIDMGSAGCSSPQGVEVAAWASSAALVFCFLCQ